MLQYLFKSNEMVISVYEADLESWKIGYSYTMFESNNSSRGCLKDVNITSIYCFYVLQFILQIHEQSLD